MMSDIQQLLPSRPSPGGKKFIRTIEHSFHLKEGIPHALQK